jgi:hypothetical protein
LTTDSPDVPKKKRLGWNPFQKLEGEHEARSAAKGGALVSGFLVLSYIIQIALVYGYNRDTFGNEGSIVLVTDVIAAVIAAILTWRIVVAQPFWASVVVAIWFYIELAMKIATVASGQQKTNAGWILMFLALFAGSILSIRGSWKLRKQRRAPT